MKEQLKQLYPHMPEVDVERAVKSALKRNGLIETEGLSHSALYWTAAAVARHCHTDYDARLKRGEDKQSARVATRDQVRAKLREWGGPDCSTPDSPTRRVSWDKIDWSLPLEDIAEQQGTTVAVAEAHRTRRTKLTII